MFKIGRNDPCPCGSGKKFKKCHMGREHELIEPLPADTAEKIKALPEVSYGRCQEMLDRLDIQQITGSDMSVKFIDLKAYLDLGLETPEVPPDLNERSVGQMVNPFKTLAADPDHVYVAVTPVVSDAALVHELAHVLDYLGGSKINPGLTQPLSLELEAPAELIGHPREFGKFLEMLRNEFAVVLDADNTIIEYLSEEGMLVPGEAIRSSDHTVLEAEVKRSVDFLLNHRSEIDQKIKGRVGYIVPSQ